MLTHVPCRLDFFVGGAAGSTLCTGDVPLAPAAALLVVGALLLMWREVGMVLVVAAWWC